MSKRNIGLFAASVFSLVMLRVAPANADDRIAITQIGALAISTPGREASHYYVNQRVLIRGTAQPRLHRGSYLYPLVRREGDFWEVQPAAQLDASSSTWNVEVEFGGKAERVRFEFHMALARGPLPLGRIPEDVLGRSTLARSRIVHVARKVSDPVVWISSIDSQIVQHADGEILNVGHQAAIEVNALDLPVRERADKARVAVAIQPVDPYSDAHWIMMDTLDTAPGLITGHFGIKRLHNHHRFRVSAFVAWALPPLGVPISSREWERVSREFLAVSKPVDVWLWYGETRISHVDGTAAIPRAVIVADAQAEVRGTVRRPLRTVGGTPERIWLVCVPRQGDPWVAGWTVTLQGGGRWVISPVPLNVRGQPSLFDLVTIVSAVDLPKVDPPKLRALLNDATERSTERVRVRVVHRLSAERSDQ